MKHNPNPPSWSDSVWDNLSEHLPALEPPDGMEERFLVRFEQELGAEEQRRQARAQRRVWWRSWLSVHRLGWAGGVAALVLLVWWAGVAMETPPPPSQASRTPTPPPASPHQLSSPGTTDNGALPSGVARSTSDPISPAPAERPGLYKDMQLYENMDVLEKIKMLEKLPVLTKGS